MSLAEAFDQVAKAHGGVVEFGVQVISALSEVRSKIFEKE